MAQKLYFFFFFFFVTEMSGRRDDEARLRRPFFRRTLRARSQGVNQKLRNGFVDIAVPYLTMGMADVDA